MDLVICIRSSHRCITDLTDFLHMFMEECLSHVRYIEFCILEVERDER